MRTLFLLKCDPNNAGDFPTGQQITENIFIKAGWADEDIRKVQTWEEKLEKFREQSTNLFDGDKGHLPESVRLKESVNKVIFYGNVNKSELLVTKINERETFVRIIHNDLSQLQETAEIVVKTIKDRFETVNDCKVSIAQDEVLVFERGYDHKIIKGTVLHKGSLLKTLKTIKKQDKGNYYLLLVVLVMLIIAITFDLLSHKFFIDLAQFADRGLLAIVGVSATPVARFIQMFLQLRSSQIIKWEPFSEPQR